MSLEGVEARTALVVHPPETGLPGLLSPSFSQLEVVYLDYAQYLRDKEAVPADVRLHFGTWPGPGGSHDLGILYFPKEKDLAEHLLSRLAAILPPGSRGLVVGPKHGGVRSAKRLLERYLGPVTDRRSARHCILMESRRGDVENRYDGEGTWGIEIGGREVKVVSLPGVFSHRELDEGTSMLLDVVLEQDFRNALDWGCGCGVIGTTLLLLRPEARVDLVDSSILALESARKTLGANDLPADRVYPSDVFSDVTGRYELIVANPPFHSGQKTTTETTRRMIKEAGSHLADSGRLVVVASAFLNYFPEFRGAFEKVRVLAETRRYRVIEGKQPAGPRRQGS
jgi:16S rRNA (guanine1207-N2)-methyltransferase